jgi:outer membrane protein assembly factor BamA
MLLALLLLFCGGARAEPPVLQDYDPLSPAYLEGVEARIGEIVIDNQDIFDLDDPRENYALYRLANRLHIRTLPRIIRHQLLFEPGDVYSQRLVEESERILRSNRYLENAWIEPVRYADGQVDVRVRTKDVWTLQPRIDYSRNGGVDTSSIGFEENNLLGTGVSLNVLHESQIDRDVTSISYADRELRGTRYSLRATYNDSDEGGGYEFDFGLPFYALDSRRANGISALHDERNDTLYDRGTEQAEFSHDEDRLSLQAGFSRGLHAGWVTRYTAGFGYQEDRFAPGGNASLPWAVLPEDRKFVYPFVGLELLQDDYAVVVNRDQIGRTEDVFRGLRLNMRLGYAATGLGSLDNAVLLDADLVKGFGEPGEKSFYAGAALSTRWQDGHAENLLLHTSANWYHRHSPRRMLYSTLSASAGSRLDLDNPLYLGGDNGLRGYPLRYQGGEQSLLFTIEERFYTSWYPFRLFRIGGAVFFDMGRTWGDNPVGAGNLGWLKDIGFGLRIGNNRTGTGKVIHIDVAFPLDGDDTIDGAQFLVEAKATY